MIYVIRKPFVAQKIDSETLSQCFDAFCVSKEEIEYSYPRLYLLIMILDKLHRTPSPNIWEFARLKQLLDSAKIPNLATLGPNLLQWACSCSIFRFTKECPSLCVLSYMWHASLMHFHLYISLGWRNDLWDWIHIIYRAQLKKFNPDAETHTCYKWQAARIAVIITNSSLLDQYFLRTILRVNFE